MPIRIVARSVWPPAGTQTGPPSPSACQYERMPGGVEIRTSVPEDRRAILELVLRAFTSVEHDGSEEVDIVVSTWDSNASALDLELVAAKEEAVVGHVLAAWGHLGGREVVGVAPLAVAPSHQGRGIGTALMTELIRRAEAAALPLIVILGDPGFYQRFGFEHSWPLGVCYRVVGEGNVHFQVRRFGSYDKSYRGDFTYCWESTPVDGSETNRSAT
jgi:putative acetyltransferase